MTRLWPALRFQLARLGWPAWLGGLFIVLALALDSLATTPQERELDAALRAARLVGATSQAERQGQKHLLAGIELAQRDMTSLETLFQAAHAAGVDLRQGDYSLEAASDGGSRRLRIQFPVSADYVALRRFLADSLNRIPALALDQIKLQRETPYETELEARVQFILFLGPAP